jgi:hypothetical protein
MNDIDYAIHFNTVQKDNVVVNQRIRRLTAEWLSIGWISTKISNGIRILSV